MKIKKLFAVAMTFVLILSHAPAITVSGETERGAEGHFVNLGHDHSGWTAWGDDIEERTTVPMTSGKYYLTQDITVSAQHRLSSQVDIELCMNGHSITSTVTNWGSLYQVYGSSGAKLKIENCKTEGVITRTVTAGNALLGSSPASASTNGSIELTNVVFDGIKGSGNGAIICMQGATTLTMTGCTIQNCENSGNGAALYLYSTGKATIKDCTIKNNKNTSTAAMASTVNLGANSSVEVDGCLFSGNTASNASAIYAVSSISGITIKNSTFKDNNTTKKGSFTGAVYIIGAGAVLEGENIIAGNTDGDGNAADLTIQNAGATFAIVDPTDDTNVNLKYANEPTITEFATITGGLKGTWTWSADSSKILDENASHKLILRDRVAVTGVSLNKTETTISYGEDETLVATITPENADNKAVTWSSGDNNVVTVDSDGKVTAVGVGSADVTVTTKDGGKTDKCTVTVPPTTVSVNGITVAPADVTTYAGLTVQLTLTFDPAGATNKNVTWGSGSDAIATVNENGLVTGVGEGSTTITATTEDGGKTAVANVTVKPSHIHGSTVYTPWVKDDSLPTASGKYFLDVYGGQINLANTWTIPGDANIELCLNGHTVNAPTGKRAISINSNATLTVTDCGVSGGKIAGGSSTNGGGIYLYAGAAFNATNIKITNNTVSSNGGAIYGGSGSTVALDVVEISGNTASQGGAIYLTGGASAEIKGSSISGNTAENGSAIVMLGGDVILEDSTVAGNNATSGFGAIHVSRGNVGGSKRMATLIVKGATQVTGNTAKGTTPQNVMLRKFADEPSLSYVSVDAAGLTSGSSIGISLDKTSSTNRYEGDGLYITAEGDTVPAGSEAYFAADSPDYGVAYDSGRLCLKSGLSVTGVSVTPASASIGLGSTATLTADVTPETALNKTVNWTSSDESVATVDSNGVVTPVAEGTANITATTVDGGFTASCAVTVYTPHMHGAEEFIPWTKTDSLPTKAGKYALTGDVTLTATAEINADISICLNGYSIIGNGSFRVIRVRPGGVFSLYDCQENQGSITGGYSTYGAGVRVDHNAVFNMYGGVITGNTSDMTSGGEGAGVYVVGKTIVSGTSYNGGVFNMYGGAITANTGRVGTAIRVYGFSGETAGDDYAPGTVNIYDGVISDNNGRTGTIYVGEKSVVNISGAEIKNNTASMSGAAVYTQADSVVTITDAEITGNEATANGGAIALANQSELHLNNVGITGNTAGGSGGGISSSVADSVIELTGKVVIEGNTDASKSNNLVLAAGQQIDAHDLTEGSKIAVTVASVPTAFTAAGTAGLINYFETNNAHSAIVAKDGRLWVDSDGTHKHCLCLDGKGQGCDHTEISWMAWESDTSLPTESGSYYLLSDVTLTEEVITAKNAEISLCLNGHTVTQTTDGKRLYRAAFGTTLSITDCEGGGKLTGGTGGFGACLRIQQNATLNLYAGTITGNESKGDSEGGGVYVLGRNTVDGSPADGGVFNMYGGVITGNTASAGAAVRIYGFSGAEDIGDTAKPGRFNMYGGLISDNTGSTGAVYLTTSAEMTMSGGKITGNTLTGSGGGIFGQAQTSITISGGTISNNISGNLGGGIMTKGDVTISGGTISGNKSAVHGGGVITEGAVKVRISGGKISKNSTDGDGGGVYVSTNGDFAMTGGEITENKAAGKGGGIVVLRNTALFKGGKISKNTSGNGGGGLYVLGAKAVANGTEFTDNKASGSGAGGGIMVSAIKMTTGGESVNYPGSLEFKSGTVSGNSAKAGGGIAVQSKDSKMTLVGGTIEKNKAIGGGGGGLFISNSTIFEMTGGKISENHATSSGGGIVIYRIPATLKGGVITGNKSDVNAGGLYVYGADVTLDGTDVTNNTAKASGGGITVGAARYTENGENVSKSGSLVFKKGTVSGNSAKNGGGIITQSKGTKLTLCGGTVEKNSVSGGHGGGVYVSTDTSFDMTSGSIKNNRSNTGEGGGLVGLRSTLNLSGGTISNNYAYGCGAGIRMMGATLNLKGTAVNNNTARINGGGIRAAKYTDKKTNTIYSSVINMTGGSVSNNTAKSNGGGVILESKGTVMKLSGGRISGNTASEAHGGGVYVSIDSRFNMTGGSISGNRANNGEGGGLVVLRTGVATLSGGSISGNYAKGSGGGIRLMGSTVYLRGTSVTANRAEINGGGIRAARNLDKTTGNTWLSKLYISGGSISKNTCGHVETLDYQEVVKGGHGSAVLVEGEGCLLEMTGGRVAENDGLAQGGIFMSTGTFIRLKGGTFDSNHSGSACGGVYMFRCSSEITGGVFTNNTCEKGGAALFYTSKADRMDIDRHYLANVEASGNTSSSGGAMVVQGRAKVSAENLYFHDNKTSTGNGGAFYLSANSYLDIKNSRFVNNNAAKLGGGIYIGRPAWLTLENCVIDGNNAEEKGGGIYSTGSLDMSSCVVSNNTAKMIGGGVVAYKSYYNVGLDVDFRRPYFRTHNNLVEGNTSGEQGGGYYINSGVFTELDGDIIRGNTAALEGGGIYMVTNTDMKNLTVTENKSGGNGAAFYIASSDYDDHSYVKGIIRMSGNMKVFGNIGKDMFLDEKTTMIVGPEGLGADSRIELELSEGLVTNRIFGEYSYEGGNLVYTITTGDKSITDPEQGEITPPVSDETEIETGESADDSAGGNNIWPFVGATAAILAVLGIVLLIIGKKKSKKDEEDK